jgi:hypothetical protein
MLNFNTKMNMRVITDNCRLAVGFTFLLILGLTCSCSTVFFDKPQPTDSRNLKTVPSKIRGTWRIVNDDYRELFKIDKTSYVRVSTYRRKIPKIRVETSDMYKIKNGKIYPADDDSKAGYDYVEKNDTIYFDQMKVEESVVLSDSALLRSAKDCYVLNLKRENWWEIVFIQKMKNGEIQISCIASDSLMLVKDRFNISVLDSTKKDATLYHAEFKSRDIAKIIPANGSGVIYRLKPDSTFINEMK